jgi:hypothetical protein
MPLRTNAAGALTAVREVDEVLALQPPPPKAKSAKKANAGGGHASATGTAAARVAAAPAVRQEAAEQPSEAVDIPGCVRKVSSETSIASCVAKKMRGRARRMTAGQMPGRYHAASRAASLVDADVEHVHSLPSPSPASSLRSVPTSPDMCEDMCEDGFSLRASSHHEPLDVHGESPYQFTDPAGVNAFPDLACLGLGGGSDADPPAALSLPSMAADPSSAETFSFCDADSAFGSPDPVLAVDPPYQRTALLTLIRDRARTPGRLYHMCVLALAHLGDRLVENRTLSPSSGAEFIRAFVYEHSADSPGGDMHVNVASRLLFPDRTLYDQAVDAFRAMCDCSYLAIFSEALVLSLLEEDVSALMVSPNLTLLEAEYAPCSAPQHDAAGLSVFANA